MLYHYLATGERVDLRGPARRARSRRGPARAAGVAPGERVGILSEDRAVFCDAFFGLSHLGAVPVPLGLAGHGRLRVVVRGARATASPASASSRSPPTPASADALGDRDARAPGHRGRRQRGATRPPPARCNPVAFIQPSSGTTGDPKGIVISQAAVLANLAGIREQWDLTERDSGFSWLPLFHDMGLIGTVINALYSGGTLHHWPTESFLRSPGRWLDARRRAGRDRRDRTAVRARARRATLAAARRRRGPLVGCVTSWSAPSRSGPR